jgi:pantothenate kinase type III
LPIATNKLILDAINKDVCINTKPIIIKPNPYKDLVFDYNLEQLGVDRFLGLVAGYDKYPEQNFMFFPTDTAIANIY